MKLKICGIKNIQDLRECVDVGVDYVGINFYSKSKRYCQNGDVLRYLSEIDLRDTKLVLVTVDDSKERIAEILSQYPIKVIQFHGLKFNRAYTVDFLEYFDKYERMLALGVDGQTGSIIKKYDGVCEKFLFDNSDGKSQNIKDGTLDGILNLINKPYIIAGGINDLNIRHFKEQYPVADCLDIASGVEEGGEFSVKKLVKIVRLFYDRK